MTWPEEASGEQDRQRGNCAVPDGPRTGLAGDAEVPVGGGDSFAQRRRRRSSDRSEPADPLDGGRVIALAAQLGRLPGLPRRNRSAVSCWRIGQQRAFCRAMLRRWRRSLVLRRQLFGLQAEPVPYTESLTPAVLDERTYLARCRLRWARCRRKQAGMQTRPTSCQPSTPRIQPRSSHFEEAPPSFKVT